MLHLNSALRILYTMYTLYSVSPLLNHSSPWPSAHEGFVTICISLQSITATHDALHCLWHKHLQSRSFASPTGDQIIRAPHSAHAEEISCGDSNQNAPWFRKLFLYTDRDLKESSGGISSVSCLTNHCDCRRSSNVLVGKIILTCRLQV